MQNTPGIGPRVFSPEKPAAGHGRACACCAQKPDNKPSRFFELAGISPDQAQNELAYLMHLVNTLAPAAQKPPQPAPQAQAAAKGVEASKPADAPEDAPGAEDTEDTPATPEAEGAPTAPENTNTPIIMALIQLIQALIAMLGQQQGSGGQASPVQGPGESCPVGAPGGDEEAGAAGAPATEAPPQSGPSGEATPLDKTADPRLTQLIDKLGSDKEGANLLAEARRRGVKIEVGAVDAGTLAHYDPNRNTIVVGEETLRRGTGLETLAHELVHATTPEDGDSKHEESTANVIANRIASRVNGTRPGNAGAIYNSTWRLYGEQPDHNAGFDNHIAGVLGGRRRTAVA